MHIIPCGHRSGDDPYDNQDSYAPAYNLPDQASSFPPGQGCAAERRPLYQAIISFLLSPNLTEMGIIEFLTTRKACRLTRRDPGELVIVCIRIH
jgi:hypothetical protein